MPGWRARRRASPTSTSGPKGLHCTDLYVSAREPTGGAASTLLPMAAFDVTDLPDMTGRTVVITGANSGIGRAAASALAGAHARVVLAVRDLDKGRAAAATIPGETEVRQLDLASLASVRAFAAGWAGDLRLLINHAAVM